MNLGGVPGSGKTQLCQQLAVNTQIPNWLGGVDGKCLYIDTEGGMIPARLNAMAEAMEQRINKFATSTQIKQTKPSIPLTTADFLSRIQLLRCTNLEEQEDVLINVLPKILRDNHEIHPPIRLIIIDSIAFHFRYTLLSVTERDKKLRTIAHLLQKLAEEYSVAIVLVNHMALQFDTFEENKNQFSVSNASTLGDGTLSATLQQQPIEGIIENIMIPSLGQVWQHAPSDRIVLGYMPYENKSGMLPGGTAWKIRTNRTRAACLCKSADRPSGVVSFCINKDGIRSNDAVKDNVITTTTTTTNLPVSGEKRKMPFIS
jgi:Rad51